jgi:integrase
MRQARQTGFDDEGSRLTPHSGQATLIRSARPSFAKVRDSDFGLDTMAMYVEHKFIPDHVMCKTPAGRAHYQAILKYVLHPEKVETIFARYGRATRTRMKASPGWPYLDDVRICDLNSNHIRELTSSAISHGYAPQTVKHIRNVIGAIVSHAQKERIFSGDNPVTGVKLPAIARTTPPNLTIRETRGILELMQYPERDIALISITTGMSVSEVCGLQWKHLNLSNSPVYLEGEIIPPRSMLIRRPATASAGTGLPYNRPRTMEIPDAMIRRLRVLKRENGQSDPSAFALHLPGSAGASPAIMRGYRLKVIGRKLGMPWLSWQLLRRAHQTFLSELRNQLSHELLPLG